MVMGGEMGWASNNALQQRAQVRALELLALLGDLSGVLLRRGFAFLQQRRVSRLERIDPKVRPLSGGESWARRPKASLEAKDMAMPPTASPILPPILPPTFLPSPRVRRRAKTFDDLGGWPQSHGGHELADGLAESRSKPRCLPMPVNHLWSGSGCACQRGHRLRQQFQGAGHHRIAEHHGMGLIGASLEQEVQRP